MRATRTRGLFRQARVTARSCCLTRATALRRESSAGMNGLKESATALPAARPATLHIHDGTASSFEATDGSNRLTRGATTAPTRTVATSPIWDKSECATLASALLALASARGAVTARRPASNRCRHIPQTAPHTRGRSRGSTDNRAPLPAQESRRHAQDARACAARLGM